jgi:tripartite-type tricarboxylate transporter receptor subunit TctC
VPADRVAVLQAAFRQAAASDRFRQLLEAQGVTPGWVEGAAMGTVMRRATGTRSASSGTRR